MDCATSRGERGRWPFPVFLPLLPTWDVSKRKAFLSGTGSLGCIRKGGDHHCGPEHTSSNCPHFYALTQHFVDSLRCAILHFVYKVHSSSLLAHPPPSPRFNTDAPPACIYCLHPICPNPIAPCVGNTGQSGERHSVPPAKRDGQ